ncbi:MAG TPA: aspartate kinase [Clostridia bacterium]|nr:aspartate kinase [Clostridia bacterium]
MGIVVQKYGGTSVASESARLSLLRHVKKAKQQGKDVVLVVSAMGRKGDPYSTDTIISLMESINTHISPEKKDLLASCGETISCSLIAHFLDTNGIEAEAMTGFQAGILTTDEFNNSNIISIDTTNIQKYLGQGKVPVIAGFQGITWDGRITTLGRGGSDTTAVELGGYLEAEMVDIFTDVPGVAFVDPRVLPSAEYISRISYDDMYLLASNGAKVIHPRAVSAAKKFGIPVRVRSTYSDEDGTLITYEPTKMEKRIIGIALDKKDIGRTSAYILPQPQFVAYIKDKFEKEISNKTIQVLEKVYNDNSIEILMENNQVADNVRLIQSLA